MLSKRLLIKRFCRRHLAIKIRVVQISYRIVKKPCRKHLAIQISVVQRLFFLRPLGAFIASIASTFPLSSARGPEDKRQATPEFKKNRLQQARGSIASIFPLSWPRGPRAMEPNLPLPGLIPLSWVFLGPVGRLYCQHLPPVSRQGPRTNDKQHLN